MTKASAKRFPQDKAKALTGESQLELICSANHPAAVQAAIDHGADWIWFGHRCDGSPLQDLHLDRTTLQKGIRHARDRGCRAMLALPENSPPSGWRSGTAAIDAAAAAGADALLLSDPALLLYAAIRYPDIQRQYALRQAALNADTLYFLHRQFGVGRVFLPPVLPLTMLEGLRPGPVELAVSSHARFLMPAKRRGGAEVKSRRGLPTDPATLCGDSEFAVNDLCFDQPASPSFEALALLPRFPALGIRAVMVEAPGQPPLRLAQATRVWREAVNDCMESAGRYRVKPAWLARLDHAA